MAEWFKRTLGKRVRSNSFVGSNPTLSAKKVKYISQNFFLEKYHLFIVFNF